MRFSSGVTHAHQWNRVGDPPETITAYESDTPYVIDPLCGSALENHGLLADVRVCPTNWVVETDDGYHIVADEPYQKALLIAEDGDTLTVVDYMQPDQSEVIKVDFYTDCRVHTQRRKFTNREERDTYAETHRADHPDHSVDTYEVER